MYFVVQIVSGYSFIWLLCFFDIPHHCGLFSWALPYCKFILNISCPILRISYFSKDPSSLFWRIILKIKICALGVLIVTEVSLILRFSADRARKYTQVYCIYSHLYIHIYKYVFIKSSVFICKLNMSIYWGLQL